MAIIYEQGSLMPKDIIADINLIIVDENVDEANNQGLKIFNKALNYLNQRGFKLPLIIADDAQNSYAYQYSKEYTPLPDVILSGFIQDYCGYLLAIVNEDTDLVTRDYQYSYEQLVQSKSALVDPQYLDENRSNFYKFT